MRPRRNCAIALLGLAVFAGCRDSESGHAHHEQEENGHAHEAETSSASFDADAGLRLSEETREAMGVETAIAGVRKLGRALRVTVTVFDPGPPARALALVPAALAHELEQLEPDEVKVLSVGRETAAALTQVEVVLSLPGSFPAGTTREVTLHGAERRVVSVPRAAVLRTATGAFVYRVNEAYFQRTPVTTGTDGGAFIEISEGLSVGDVVAAAAVEPLWLTELRLTKGGGHSH